MVVTNKNRQSKSKISLSCLNLRMTFVTLYHFWILRKEFRDLTTLAGSYCFTTAGNHEFIYSKKDFVMSIWVTQWKHETPHSGVYNWTPWIFVWSWKTLKKGVRSTPNQILFSKRREGSPRTKSWEISLLEETK